MQDADVRGGDVMLLGYEVRAHIGLDWDPSTWGDEPIPLHQLPHNRLVAPGVVSVRGYGGFWGLAPLTEHGVQTLRATIDVARDDHIPFGKALAAMQYEAEVYAFTPPVSAAVRFSLCRVTPMWRGRSASSWRRTTRCCGRTKTAKTSACPSPVRLFFWPPRGRPVR